MLRLVNPGLLVAGIINLLPVAGVFGGPWLQSLYAIQIGSADLEILLRHRALLFGIIGVLLISAVFRPSLRGAALFSGAASMVSFIAIAWLVGGYNPLLSRIIVADLAGLAALIPAGVATFGSYSRR
ncbi:MAG: hypothetical protein ACRCTD_12850 [Beijerinckiaceae bacterium]